MTQGKADQPGERPERPEGEAEESNAGGDRSDRGIRGHAGRSGSDSATPGVSIRQAASTSAPMAITSRAAQRGQEHRQALGARRWQCQLRWNFSH